MKHGRAAYLATSLPIPNRVRCFTRIAPLTLVPYLHGPGTGITNLPSFSAMKFSVLLLKLPLASFFSIVIMTFLLGLSQRKTVAEVPSSG